MDWQATIGRHHAALKRVVAAFAALVGVTAGPRPGARAGVEPRPTHARQRHRALLRLVRPAEAAARRLVIVLALALPAQGEPVDAVEPALTTPPSRPTRKRRHFLPVQPEPTSAFPTSGVGTGIVLPAHWSASRPQPETPPRALRLPLTDPARRVRRVRRVVARDLPRIWAPGCSAPVRLPPRLPPAPDDRLDATRLVLRIQALADALDDLPREAGRFRRWRVRHLAAIAEARQAEAARGTAIHTARTARAAPRHRRVSPLRSGRPPGGRRKPAHEVHAILAALHELAFDRLAHPDTS
jgi:hypothetical protein